MKLTAMTKLAIAMTETVFLPSAQGEDQLQMMMAVVPAPVLAAAAAALAEILGMIRKMAKHQLGELRLSSSVTSTTIS